VQVHKFRIAVVIAIVLLVLTTFCPVSFAQDQGQALIEAAKRGDLKQVQALLDKSVDVSVKDKSGWTALMHAAFKDHFDIVQLLLDKGAYINEKERDELRLTEDARHRRITDLLQQRGAMPSLEVAAMLGNAEKVRECLEKGINDEVGGTALRAASKRGHFEVVKVLVAGGVNVNAKDKEGETALIEAAYDHFEIVKTLLASGADVNARTRRGWTALMEAAVNDNFEIVKALLDNGADINAQDIGGDTALNWASYKGSWGVKMVKFLKAHGGKE
jgi:uncharacterized protein